MNEPGKIEYDELDPTRAYIPLPGGWEVQTKGKGSSYRLLDKKTKERFTILSGKDWEPLQAFFTRFANEVHEASKLRLKPLIWSEHSPPNEKCRYDHITADTSPGKFSIEWKSWKQYPGYSLYLADSYLQECYSLDEAKEVAFRHLESLVLNCLEDGK